MDLISQERKSVCRSIKTLNTEIKLLFLLFLDYVRAKRNIG